MLIATRVPVTRHMCRYVGIDIEQWLQDDLLDVLTTAVGCMPFTNPIRSAEFRSKDLAPPTTWWPATSLVPT